MQQQQNGAHDLPFFQVRAVSVRVSIETALKDLKRGKESCGEIMNSDGHKPTDGMIFWINCTKLLDAMYLICTYTVIY